MKKRLLSGSPIILVLLVLAIAFSVREHKNRNYDYEDFAKDFKKAGYDIGGVKKHNEKGYFWVDISFEKDGQNSEIPLQVTEYSDSSLMTRNIEQNKQYVNATAVVDYPAPPHYYHRGKIVVCYLGYNKEFVSDLEKLLGKQFASR